MGTVTDHKGVFKIAAFSGYTGDKADALQRQAESSGCPVLFGDYLAEMNLAWRALEVKDHPELGYERPFLLHLGMAAKAIAANKCKVVTNAGALNPKGLAEACVKLLKGQGIDLKVAYVEGDNIIDRLPELAAAGETLGHLEDARPLSSWGLTPLTANAYVGGRGVRAALEAGADIVISGRCTDASPVIGAAAWWHNWSWDQYDVLAGALLAGHCIECGAYVTGANSSGFKAIKDSYFNFAMGIAEIEADGTFVITKQPNENGFNGIVDIPQVTSQILYEIQNNVYLNPDVQGIIDDIKVEKVGKDRVRVTGVRGIAPPNTTKAAVCAVAGYQAETSIFATGLDVQEKFDVYRLQIKTNLGEKILPQFTMFDITQYGVAAQDPQTEGEATAMLRIVAQAPKIEAFGPYKNLLALVHTEGLGHFPGFQNQQDTRLAEPKPYIEYWPGRVSVAHLPLTVGFVGSDEKITVPPVEGTTAVQPQADYDAKTALQPGEYGSTTRGPLGWIVHARSGDKGGNANVGFFVRHADEYPWLRSLLSKDTLRHLLAKEYTNNKIERVEFPGLLAVHFVIHDYLGKGVSSTARMDALAKSVAEYLRSKYVDLPDKYLARGKL